MPFLLNDPPATEFYTLSLHDALPISHDDGRGGDGERHRAARGDRRAFPARRRLNGRARHVARFRIARSEEHTSELQSQFQLVCRLLLEKKNTSTDCFQLPSL